MSEILADEVINIRDRFRPNRSLVPKVDEAVSKVVGKKVFCLDPRLIKLIVRWKGNKSSDSLVFDNFLDDPKCVEELKKVFA